MGTPADDRCVRFAAAGDILLASPAPGASASSYSDSIYGDVKDLFADCDVVLGNLECTLPGVGETVPTEPRVIATPELVRTVKPAGFNVLTLANNHAFDCLAAGFHHVRGLLDELGIAHFGAGDNLEEASRPAVLEANGIRIAFLAAVGRRTGAAHVATTDHWGVAPMDVDRLADDIRRLRDEVHHVILSLHWGEERFLIPSPEQVEQAHRLADAGASMIIGHHPHVIQGMEVYRGVPIIYSLGNLVACEVPYSDGDTLTWNRKERTGCLLLAELTLKDVRHVHQVPAFDSGQSVSIDRTGFGRGLITRANRALSRGVTLGRYRREHLWVKTLKPALRHLLPSELLKLRPAKIRKAIAGILQARRAR